MVQPLPDAELREQTQRLLRGQFKHVRAAALAAALVPLASVAVESGTRPDGWLGRHLGRHHSASRTRRSCRTSTARRSPVATSSGSTAVISAQGAGGAPVSVMFTDSTIRFESGGTPYTVSVPTSMVDFSPGTNNRDHGLPGLLADGRAVLRSRRQGVPGRRGIRGSGGGPPGRHPGRHLERHDQDRRGGSQVQLAMGRRRLYPVRSPTRTPWASSRSTTTRRAPTRTLTTPEHRRTSSPS